MTEKGWLKHVAKCSLKASRTCGELACLTWKHLKDKAKWYRFFSFNYACVYCREHCVNVSCWLWHGRVKAPSASVPWEWQSLPVVQVWMLIVWAENVYVQLAFTAPRLHTYRDCFYWEYLNLPHCPSVGDILPPCPLVCNSPCLCSAVHNSLGFQDVIAFLYKPLWVCVSAFFFFFPSLSFFFFFSLP